MENNSFEVTDMYNMQYDILIVKVKRPYTYGKTVELEDGVLLDFDKNNIPVAIEILDASERFNIPKYSLNKIACFNMRTIVNTDVIKVFIRLGVIIHNKEQSETWTGLISNQENIPVIETELITA